MHGYAYRGSACEPRGGERFNIVLLKSVSNYTINGGKEWYNEWMAARMFAHELGHNLGMK